MTQSPWSRRDLLKLLALAPAASWLPATAEGRAAAGAVRRHPHHRLVLVELGGGNDGLNTVVPWRDPAYARLRPRLGVARSGLTDLGGGLGMHPALAPLAAAWKAGDLAWALGVGYATPNRSHFRSGDIWIAAGDGGERRGWLGRTLGRDPSAPAEALVLGGDDAGPLRQSAARAVLLERPEAFVRMARRVRAPSPAAASPALQHLVRVQRDLRGAAGALERHLGGARAPGGFPKHRFGRHCQLACHAIQAGLPVPVVHLTLGGFDTHANQAGRHARLLGQLAEGLAALRAGLVASGDWGRTLVMTWSEFGRRPQENGSRGTDHGTAAPHLLMGGAVRGRLIGAQPRLDDLVDGDLRASMDFRRLHHTAAAWLGRAPVGFDGGVHLPLRLG